MRTNRIKRDGEGIYHLISRVVDRDFKLDDEEKDIFVRMMRKAERFSGIDVLTYAVMSNHFHILVRVPDVNPNEISNEELLNRYRALYCIFARGLGKIFIGLGKRRRMNQKEKGVAGYLQRPYSCCAMAL